MESTDFLLILSAFVAATISGFLGMAGGTFLLTIMAQFFPPMILIPLHGVVQFGSNVARASFSFGHIRRNIVLLFFCGAILGAVIGSQIVVTLPEYLYKFILGSFILVITWMPEFKNAPKIPGKFFFLGLVSVFLSLFIGATGPLQAPFFLKEGLKKEVLVATKAACQTLQHFFKVVTFVALGVSLSPYLFLLSGMVIAVFLGAYAGKKLLYKISEEFFLKVFKIVITLLAIRMIVVSLGS